MKVTLRLIMPALIAGLILINTAYAQSYRNQFSITSDNDLYTSYKNDRYYTDGTIFNFTHALNFSPATNPNLVTKTLEFEFGQKIYNPYSPDVPNPKLQDRPFTAYLFAGASMNLFYVSESALKMNVEVGTIGPDALGKQIQTGFHQLLGIQKVDGWQYQLNNEVGVNLNLDYKKMIYCNDDEWFDLGYNPTGWLGNTFTGASIGLMFRIGQLDRYYESVFTNSRVSSDIEKLKHEFYFFAVPTFEYIGYDATIEGGLFTKNKGPVTFGINHTVFVQQLGVQFSSARWSASYIAYIKTKEVVSTAVPDTYGSLNLSFRFGKN